MNTTSILAQGTRCLLLAPITPWAGPTLAVRPHRKPWRGLRGVEYVTSRNEDEEDYRPIIGGTTLGPASTLGVGRQETSASPGIPH